MITGSFIGLKKEGNKLRFTPCVPQEWPSFEISYRFGESHYQIQFIQTTGEKSTIVTLDGIVQVTDAVELINDGNQHHVLIEMFSKD